MVGAHLWHRDTIVVGKHRKTLLTGADDIVTSRYGGKQRRYVSLLDNLQILVRRVAAEAAHRAGRVVYRDAALAEQRFDVRLFEGVCAFVNQYARVAKKHQSENLPHHISAVGIEEVHAPAFARRREATQHQQSCVRRQEGF